MAFVHSEKTFKHTALILLRNADARILYGNAGMPHIPVYGNAHGTAFFIVFDRIIAEIIHVRMKRLKSRQKFYRVQDVCL